MTGQRPKEDTMFRNAVVGVDGTQGGRDAVALAQRLLAEDGKLTLVHVHEGRLHPLHPVTPGLLDEEGEASEQLLREELENAGEGVKATLISAVGASAGATLHSQAEELDADLIVVGSSRHGAIGRVMLGDDTRRALNGSPCAVAIASKRYAEHPKPFERIGVGYNDTPESRAALELARQVAAPTRARVQALEVIAIPTYAYTGMVAASIGDEIDVVLKQAGERLRALPGVEGSAVYGLTGEELAAFGDEVDLLVVGSRGYGPWKRLVLGSTSDYLERHARCSLLVLPRAATQAGAREEPSQSQAAAGTRSAA
jgi:nucleotide-binding universal stress UspA family protein